MGGGGHNVPFVVDPYGVRRLSLDEIVRLQCLRPGECKFPAAMTESTILSMLGNAICIDVADLLFSSIREVLKEVRIDEPELELS